jgi:ATP-dependent RNA helicase RhlE
MLDMGFINDIKKIHNHIPKKVQTLFFSATMDPKIMDLAHNFLDNPKEIRIAPETTTVDSVSQHLYMVSKENKKDLLLHFLKTHPIKSVVVFMKTKHGANKLEKVLLQNKVKAAAIHGNKSQNNRQKALKALQDGSIQVLVATDVAARGIDVSALSHVINFDIPLEPEAYVHRIGRT